MGTPVTVVIVVRQLHGRLAAADGGVRAARPQRYSRHQRCLPRCIGTRGRRLCTPAPWADGQASSSKSATARAASTRSERVLIIIDQHTAPALQAPRRGGKHPASVASVFTAPTRTTKMSDGLNRSAGI